jgi:spore maturation protein CgeD
VGFSVGDSKISVIITSYNKPNTVGKAIESVLNQTYGNWELFIMDDNSNQGTVQVIKKYLTDKRIYYFNSFIEDGERYKTTRYATLINEAIPKTSGEYITYLTDDTLFLPHRFKIMVGLLENNPKIEIVYSQQLIKWLDEKGRFKREMTRYTKGILTNAAEKVDHCSVMHTRNILKKIKGDFGNYWDDDPTYWFYGDAAFWNRVSKYGHFYPIPETLDISFKSTDSFQSLFAFLPKTIPDGVLIKGPSTDIYMIEQQKRRKICPNVFHTLKYDKKKVVMIPDPFVYKYEEGANIDGQVFSNITLMPNQRIIKSPERSDVFLIQNNQKNLIHEKAFRDYHFDFTQIILVNEQVLDQLPEGSPIMGLFIVDSLIPEGVLFKFKSDFYLSISNHLHFIESSVAQKLNLSVQNPVQINETFLSKCKKGEPITRHLPFKK